MGRFSFWYLSLASVSLFCSHLVFAVEHISYCPFNTSSDALSTDSSCSIFIDLNVFGISLLAILPTPISHSSSPSPYSLPIHSHARGPTISSIGNPPHLLDRSVGPLRSSSLGCCSLHINHPYLRHRSDLLRSRRA